MSQNREIFARLRGVIFDLDGTLVTSELDLDRIRSEAGVPAAVPILEYLDSAQDPERERTLRVLLAHEGRAAQQCSLLPGVAQMLSALRGRGLKLALLTRNSRATVQHVLERFGIRFDCCVTREDAKPKPSADAVLKIAEALRLQPAELLVVGDYVFDMQAGRAAGAPTALLKTNEKLGHVPEADVVLHDLTELLDHFSAREAV